LLGLQVISETTTTNYDIDCSLDSSSYNGYRPGNNKLTTLDQFSFHHLGISTQHHNPLLDPFRYDGRWNDGCTSHTQCREPVWAGGVLDVQHIHRIGQSLGGHSSFVQWQIFGGTFCVLGIGLWDSVVVGKDSAQSKV
jgi:hypothetical protein